MFLVYLLRNNNKSYIGYTNNFERRLRQHNGEIKGGAKYTTRNKSDNNLWKPICIVYGFEDKCEAMKCEWKWKRKSGYLNRIKYINYIFNNELKFTNKGEDINKLNLSIYTLKEYYKYFENIKLNDIILFSKKTKTFSNMIYNMAEQGCLSDGCFQNLEVEGNTMLNGNINFIKKHESISNGSRTLLSSDSGTIFSLEDGAAPIDITLPAHSPGIHFEFCINASFSASLSIEASNASDTFIGSAFIYSFGSASGVHHFPPNSTYKILIDSSINGGVVGGNIRISALKDKWHILAHLLGEGILTTPFT